MSSSKNHTPSNCLSTILHHLICSNNLSSPLHPLTQLHNPHHHHHHHHHDHDHDASAIVESNSQAHQSSQTTTTTTTTTSQEKQVFKRGMGHLDVGSLQTSQEPKKDPGIVARLMGLDSLPHPHHQNYDSFHRSKSLNSLKFLPNFDPTQVSTFHRRATTTSAASFREREKGDEYFVHYEETKEFKCSKMKGCEVGREDWRQDEKQSREKKMVMRSGRGCVRTETSKQRRRKNNNYPRNKIKIENNAEILQSDVPSRSPVSVLHHHHGGRRGGHGFDSPSTGNSKLVISSPRRKSTGNKLKILDEKAPQAQGVAKLKFLKKNQGCGGNNGRWEDSNSTKTEMEMVGYFEVMFRQVSKLVEEEISDPKRWSIKYEMLKLGFMQHFCEHFGLQILDFLLDELMHELNVN